MNMDEYQQEARKFMNVRCDNLEYLLAGLIEEVGELAGKYKRKLRGDGELDDSWLDEGGDILWYLSQFFGHLRVPLSKIAKKNIEKLTDRKNRNCIEGSGDSR